VSLVIELSNIFDTYPSYMTMICYIKNNVDFYYDSIVFIRDTWKNLFSPVFFSLQILPFTLFHTETFNKQRTKEKKAPIVISSREQGEQELVVLKSSYMIIHHIFLCFDVFLFLVLFFLFNNPCKPEHANFYTAHIISQDTSYSLLISLCS